MPGIEIGRMVQDVALCATHSGLGVHIHVSTALEDVRTRLLQDATPASLPLLQRWLDIPETPRRTSARRCGTETVAWRAHTTGEATDQSGYGGTRSLYAALHLRAACVHIPLTAPCHQIWPCRAGKRIDLSVRRWAQHRGIRAGAASDGIRPACSRLPLHVVLQTTGTGPWSGLSL
jgi:hypothetical protein